MNEEGEQQMLILDEDDLEEEQEEEEESKSEQQTEFDEKAKELMNVRSRLEASKQLTENLTKKEENLEEEIRALIDNGVKGHEWEAIDEVVRRAVGNPAEPEIDALMILDPRLVRETSGKVTLNYSPDDKFRILELLKYMKEKGHLFKDEPPVYKPATMSTVQNVLKDRRDLQRKAEEIYSLLDLKVTKKLKVMPTIFGE